MKEPLAIIGLILLICYVLMSLALWIRLKLKKGNFK